MARSQFYITVFYNNIYRNITEAGNEATTLSYHLMCGVARYLVLSVAYTKIILLTLTFYLCIACHALTHYFFRF